MPNGGVNSSGIGLRLQPTTPGVQDGGNANVSGDIIASHFTTNPLGALDVTGRDELFGHGLTVGGAGSSVKVMVGTNLSAPTAQTEQVVMGYNSTVQSGASVAIGHTNQAGYAGGGDTGARKVAIGVECNAGTNASEPSNQVAMGCQANCNCSGSSSAVGFNVRLLGPNTADGSQVAYGAEIDADNDAGNTECAYFGFGIAMPAAPRANVLLMGYWGRTASGAFPASEVQNNTILIGNQNQTNVRIGAYSLPSGFTVPIFIQTASATVANTITETTLTAAGEGSLTIPANTLRQGSNLRIRARGVISNTGTPTLRIRVKIGGTTVIDTTAITFPTLTGTHGWTLDADATIRTSGAGGTMIANGTIAVSVTGSPDLDSLNTITQAINTTIGNAVDMTAEWGTANVANTITCTHLSIERMR